MAMPRRRRQTGLVSATSTAIYQRHGPGGCLWAVWWVVVVLWGLFALALLADSHDPGTLITAVFLIAITGGPLSIPLWVRRNRRRRTIEAIKALEHTILTSGIRDTDGMDPYEFEERIALALEALGWRIAQRHGGRGDRGADIIAERGPERLVIQAKCYTGQVGHDAVQEVYAAKAIFGATRAAVATNSYFTPYATQHAHMTSVELWDRDRLVQVFSAAASTVEAATSPVQPATPPALPPHSSLPPVWPTETDAAWLQPPPHEEGKA